eukprot:1161178-Pelagomonas_calceolata.AAC.7
MNAGHALFHANKNPLAVAVAAAWTKRHNYWALLSFVGLERLDLSCHAAAKQPEEWLQAMQKGSIQTQPWSQPPLPILTLT